MSPYVLATAVAGLLSVAALAWSARGRSIVAVGEPGTARRAFVLVAMCAALGAGFAVKVPFLAASWAPGGHFDAFTPLGYSDLSTLYFDRGLDRDRIPYVEGKNEYPVLSGVTMWIAAATTTGARGFDLVVCAVMAIAGIGIALVLERWTGRRALIFALAPIVVLEAFVNLDLLAIFLATAAIGAFLARRDRLAGVLVGLGAAAKLYPVLLLPLFWADRYRRDGVRSAANVVWPAAAAWLAVNVPFMLANADGWAAFFRFSSERQAVGGSSWSILCRTIVCPSIATMNAASLALFAFGAMVVWVEKTNRDPDAPRWTLILPLVALFLVTNKIYSPQYSLWMLPLFALVMPDLRLVVAFVAADVGVYLSEMASNFDDLLSHPTPLWAHNTAVILRAFVLLVCVVAYVLRPQRGLTAPGEGEREGTTAAVAQQG